jgi:C1A family cysteine protease
VCASFTQTLLIALLFVGMAAAEISIDEESMQSIFTGYIARFNKVYPTEQFFQRYQVFKSNYLNVILKHNNLPVAQQKGVKLGLSSLTDLSHVEYKKLLGFKLKNKAAGHSKKAMDEGPLGTNEAINWIDLGGVNAVKDQGSCGSCWAFSAVAGAECAVFLATKKLPSLSEQQLVDCTNNAKYDCEGCDGCLMHKAFNYMIDNKGLCTETEYPYAGVDQTCKVTAGTVKCATPTPILSYTNVTCSVSGFCSAPLIPANETSEYDYVKKGVLSIAVEADTNEFQNYKSGVLDDAECGTSLDHGVAIVGFGTEDGKDYWLVRNSWGATWGDNGYLKIARGKNICGIAEYSNQPYAE